MRVAYYKILTVLAFSGLFHLKTSAQQSNFGNWIMYFGNQYVNKSWNWYNELQYRNYNFVGDLEQLILRTGIGHDLTESNNNVLLGFAYIYSEKYPPDSKEKISSNEFRIYQQFITKQNFGRFFILHRYRIEERFFPNDVDVRFRYLLSLNIPLTSKSMSKNTLYFSAYNEILLNAEKPVFDQDRVYGAFGYVINKYMKAELGVMTQFFENRDKNQFQIAFYNNIPFKKSDN